ncbi:hypothetical protein GF312_12290 [Candidatus Poribacteria bacterium]|nr:hypothetical protein [Candidatus Poribacteria bacterium]
MQESETTQISENTESQQDTPVPGSETRSGDLVEVKESEVIPGDLLTACKTLNMKGKVRGDLLAGGVYLNVGNSIGRDLTVGGYNIHSWSSVKENARLGGANIKIQGVINGDLLALGGNVEILGEVKGDVITGGGKIRISGNIHGSLEARCGEMLIDGSIGQNVDLTVARLRISPNAVVKGNLEYVSNRSAEIEKGAFIAGIVERRSGKRSVMTFWDIMASLANRLPENPEKFREWRSKTPGWFRILLQVSPLVSLLIAGLVILILYERHVTMVANRIIAFPLKSFGMGLLFLACVPIGSIILCLTIIGIPIGIIALAAYIVFLFVSRIYVGLAIGREILERITKHELRIIWQMILGILLIAILTAIPYIGWLIGIVFISFGLGGMITTGRRTRLLSKEE